MSIRKYILSLLFFLLAFDIHGQQQPMEQLGIQYYQRKEFDKSAEIFGNLYKNNQRSDYYYNYYLNSLLALEDFNEAENLVKRHIRHNSERPQYLVDLGYIYSLSGDNRRKDRQYQAAMKNMQPNEQSVHQLANAFIQRREYQYAINTYLEGRKLLNMPQAFAFSMAELYRVQKKITEMVSEYLLVLAEQPHMMHSVQNRLQDDVLDDNTYQKVRELLIREVQQSSYSHHSVELLTWLFVQKKEFAEAFRQQRALDKRSPGNNVRMIQLADICIANQAYQVADEIYQYILEKGQTTPYFYHAKFGQIDVKYLSIMQLNNPAKDDLLEVERLYTNFLNHDFYRHLEVSEKVLLRLAEIKGVFLKKPNEAIDLLERYLLVPQINNFAKAKMKLALGDYYILIDDVWEATLLYLQVSKDFPDHPLGHEAKYRSARLSFYRGDFEWANTQLDVLKASTSELIANDALRLALLIQDNIAFDSDPDAMLLYARAEFFIFKQLYDTAIKILDRIIRDYPSHSIADNVLFAKASIAEKQDRYKDAVDLFTDVFSKYPSELLADVAIYKAAVLAEEKLKDTGYASELYMKILFEYPDSVFSVDSRNRYRALRDKKQGT